MKLPVKSDSKIIGIDYSFTDGKNQNWRKLHIKEKPIIDPSEIVKGTYKHWDWKEWLLGIVVAVGAIGLLILILAIR